MLETKKWMNICRKAGVASLSVGQPGIGKSDKARQYAQDVALEYKRMFIEWNKINDVERLRLVNDPEYRKTVYIFFDIRLVNYEPTDLKGLPDFQRTLLAQAPEVALEMAEKKDQEQIEKKEEQMEREEISVVRWVPNIQFYVMAQPETAGCTFFDEITLCPPSIQAAAYQVILDRAIGDITLSKEVFMTAAGNRPEDKTGAFALGMALKNRFSHRTELPPTIDAWTDWAIENDVHSDIIAYLNFQPSHIIDNMSAAYKHGGNAYATHRTWTMGSSLLKAGETEYGKLPYEDQQDLIESVVGQGHAVTYRGFVELLKDIKLEDVVKNPQQLSDWGATGSDLDKIWAVIGALPDWYKGHQTADTRTAILDMVDHLDIDFAVAMIRMLLRRYDQLSGQFLKCPNKTVVAKIARYL